MKLSIFIDFHNLWSQMGKDRRKTENVLAEIVKMGRERGEVLETRLFVPIYHFDKDESQETWRWINFLLHKFTFNFEGCPVSSMHTIDGVRKAKDSVDQRVSMFVDNHVHWNTGSELIVFVTGDVDFMEFSGRAQNKGKQTEFWSVKLSNTSYFIRREANFSQVDTDSSFQENPFLTALVKANKKEELTTENIRRLALVAKMAQLQIRGQEIESMSRLMSEHLGISIAESELLLDMLTTLKVAEVNPATKWVINIDYFHGLFQFLQNYKDLDGTVAETDALR